MASSAVSEEKISSQPLPVDVEKQDAEAVAQTDVPAARSRSDNVPYTIFTIHEKRFLCFIVTFAALFSPISTTIYYPALSSLASDLHVSSSLINLTITTFMIFQGLAPAFIGAFADAQGRRPAYIICFVIYIGANVGLALQKNYAALMVLRAVQSTGSSGTVALGNAVISDFALPHERGSWMGWTNAGALLGPAIGPVIGGLLDQYLGWRSIFWFLTILSGVYVIPILTLFPESCRAVVGNGSRRPGSKYNTCLLDPVIKRRVAKTPEVICDPVTPRPLRFPNPLDALGVMFEKEASLVLFPSALVFSGFYALMAALPSSLAHAYGLNALHVGLCFLASGGGGTMAALVSGRLMDWNFRRHAHKLGLDASDTRKLRSLSSFPIEAARVELAVPCLFSGAALILAFGWVLHAETHLAGPLTLLFFIGVCTTGSFTILITLTVDLFPEKPATAVAASNWSRGWIGGGATALVVPMINAWGTGWTFTFIAAVCGVMCPALLALIKWGPGMRKAKEEKLRAKKEKEAAKPEQRGG